MKIRFALLAASTALALSLTAPAFAGSATSAYVADIRQQVDFLDQASRLALDKGGDAVRDFAKGERDEQGRAATALRDWDGRNGPMVVASAEPVLTGRSAAEDQDVSLSFVAPDAGVMMPSPTLLAMPRLSSLSGAEFDKAYLATQAATLRELAGFYEAYGRTGDDPVLRAMAQREWPVVTARIAAIGRI